MKKDNVSSIYYMRNIFSKFYYLTIVFLLISCNKEDFVEYRFQDETSNYNIVFPKTISKDKENFITISNYLSLHDSIKKNRYPVVYLFVEDTIIGKKNNIIKLAANKKVKFAEYYVYDKKFNIPNYLIENKKGNYKLTIAILDIYIKDTIKANPDIKGDIDKVDMSILDSRSYHDIKIE